MKIGLYFGSFNPIHNGHLIIASHVLNEMDIDKVWFVVSPHNPFKSQQALLNEYDRLHLVRVSVEDDVRMRASDIEFALPRPSYTIDTLTYLKEKYPNDEFFVIMGSDSFQNIERWKNYELVLDHHVVIYYRPGFEIDQNLAKKVTILEAPLLQISATHIRELIRAGKSIRYLVPDKAREEIEQNRYYKK